jgi:preprotein translocase SecE subunit
MANEEITQAGSPSKLAVARDFLVETRAEMDKVSWPAKPELVASTRAVIIGALILGLAIGVVDRLLQVILVDGVALLAR